MTDTTIPPNAMLDAPVEQEIASYLDPKSPKSFFLFAGAGSGKTRSLINALNFIRENHAYELALKGHRVGVITYTNAARDEINRRVDFNSLFQVSTIHSFSWDLIKGFSYDIREWLRINLRNEIAKLQREEEKGRAGTKASITRKSKIASKTKRLETLDTVRSFIYSPNGENSERNSLNHSEVIAICSAFISEKPLMRWILIGRFPFLFIDESQDTNSHLVDALFIVAKEHPDKFALGLIGDVMQRIYPDGKERIEEELPKEWGKPTKKLNHRCPKRIVQLINKIREPVDNHFQVPRTDAIEGKVRLFIQSINVENKIEIEDSARQRMAEISADEEWKKQNCCKLLTLEHHMSAKRLGFENVFTPLYRIDSWRTGLLNGTLPALRFFTDILLPLVKAEQQSDKFASARIVRSHSPLISPQWLKEAADPGELLRRAQSSVDALLELWEKGEPTCAEVLSSVANSELFEIPDILKPIVAVLQADEGNPEDDVRDPLGPESQALLTMMKAPFSELDLYLQYVLGLASFDTHQGVKGLEFQRVMVIMDDNEARGFMFGYGKLFGEEAPTKTDQKKASEGRDTSIDRTRRLFYVTSSRAECSLALVAYVQNPEAVKKHVIQSGWFNEDEIEI